MQRAQTCRPPREATDFFLDNGMLFMPGKASNAGGVAYVRTGDVPEQHAYELDLRGSGCKTESI